MGHQDRRPIPRSPRWVTISDLIAAGAPPEEVLRAMRGLLVEGFDHATRDPGFLVVARHLVEVSTLAEDGWWPDRVAREFPGGVPPSGFAGAIALSGVMGAEVRGLAEMRTALADIALGAAVGTLIALTDRPQLSEPDTEATPTAVVRVFGGSDGFGAVVERFLASFTFAYIDTLLSRNLPRQTGNGLRFQILSDRVSFSDGVQDSVTRCCEGVRQLSARWYTAASPSDRPSRVPAAMHDGFRSILLRVADLAA